MSQAALTSRLSRRRLLLVSGAAALTVALPEVSSRAAPDARTTRWSERQTWGGSDHQPDIVIDRPVLLDVDASVASLVITESGSLAFDPTRSVTLESDGNVVVRGLLQMRPDNASRQHRLVFRSVDEARFIGGGMDVLDTDTGLWVRDRGRLDLVGSPRLPWVRLQGSPRQGERRIIVAAEPAGWREGDEIVLTPTLAPSGGDPAASYDTVRILAVRGRTVLLDRPLQFDHPSMPLPDGRLLGGEVLNLTRNVEISGTPGGRAHVNVRAQTAQQVAYVSLRQLAPRQPDEKYTRGVMGRYAWHMHHCGEGSRGTALDGVVARDCGGHAFVSHASHGTTYRDCMAHNTIDDAFWWDQAPDTRTRGPESHDTVYERCVASRILAEPSFRGFRLAGFVLGNGIGNRVLDCIAVGVSGNKDSSGFHWPEGADGVWEFSGAISHNNARHGLFCWQNNQDVHRVHNFISYHNAGAGISHGAYRNSFQYYDGYLLANDETGVMLHALSAPGVPLLFQGLYIDGAGRSRFAVTSFQHHATGSRQPLSFYGCHFVGVSQAAIGLVADASDRKNGADLMVVEACTIERDVPQLLFLNSKLPSGALVIVRQAGARDVLVHPVGGPGEARPEWNATTQRGGRYTPRPQRELLPPTYVEGGRI